MTSDTTRRGFLLGTIGGAVGASLAASRASGQAGAAPAAVDPVGDAATFPAQPHDLVLEVVGASHGRFDRVKELVAAYPELAKSSVDWGFGDWESPIEAASHTGRREIATYLMEHGARPNLFTHAMLGELEVVKAILTAQPDLRKTPGPHGLSLLHHGKVGGEKAAAVVSYLQTLGGADAAPSPASKELAAAILGTYTATTSPAYKLEVVENSMGLAIKGNSGIPRNLVAEADGSFHPAGAPSVRFRFQITDGRAKSIEVAMGGKTFQASRVQ